MPRATTQLRLLDDYLTFLPPVRRTQIPRADLQPDDDDVVVAFAQTDINPPGRHQLAACFDDDDKADGQYGLPDSGQLIRDHIVLEDLILACMAVALIDASSTTRHCGPTRWPTDWPACCLLPVAA